MEISVSRGAILVAVAAILDAAVGPYLTFGWISVSLTILCVVAAASGLGELQAMLLGFFGGILMDALGVGPGLFGAGALSGVAAGMIAARTEILGRKGPSRLLLAQAVVIAVIVSDLIRLAAVGLSGMQGPPVVGFVVGGVLPDVILNGFLALLIGERLVRLVELKSLPWV